MQERKKQDALAAANKLTDALVDHLNVGVAQALITIDLSMFFFVINMIHLDYFKGVN